MARAVFRTSAPARARPRASSRVSGDEMPTDATISPSGSRIGVVDEEHLDPLVDGEMRRLAERGRQILQVVVKERAEHGAPVAA